MRFSIVFIFFLLFIGCGGNTLDLNTYMKQCNVVIAKLTIEKSKLQTELSQKNNEIQKISREYDRLDRELKQIKSHSSTKTEPFYDKNVARKPVVNSRVEETRESTELTHLNFPKWPSDVHVQLRVVSLCLKKIQIMDKKSLDSAYKLLKKGHLEFNKRRYETALMYMCASAFAMEQIGLEGKVKQADGRSIKVKDALYLSYHSLAHIAPFVSYKDAALFAGAFASTCAFSTLPGYRKRQCKKIASNIIKESQNNIFLGKRRRSY